MLLYEPLNTVCQYCYIITAKTISEVIKDVIIYILCMIHMIHI